MVGTIGNKGKSYDNPTDTKGRLRSALLFDYALYALRALLKPNFPRLKIQIGTRSQD